MAVGIMRSEDPAASAFYRAACIAGSPLRAFH